MIYKLLKTAFENGSEVIVETRYSMDGFKGRIIDLNKTSFTLFHSGMSGGMLWAFNIKDIATCGLVVELPSQLMNENTTEKNLIDSQPNPKNKTNTYEKKDTIE